MFNGVCSLLTRSSDRMSKILAVNLRQTTYASTSYSNRCDSGIFGTRKTQQTSRNADLFCLHPHRSYSAQKEAPKKKVNALRLKIQFEKRQKRVEHRRDTEIDLPEYISAKGLSSALGVRTVDILKVLIKMNECPETSEDLLNKDLVDLVVAEYDRIPIRKTQSFKDRMPRRRVSDPSFPPRPPVITIMGHIDHGKTTLLDRLKKSNVAQNEFGGITQHLGAFITKLKSGEQITVLDTPGHEAFIKMRKRGAQLTDIAVLVVAADDGVQEQTYEAIKHIQEAKLPMIVALNKIDKRDADPEKVKIELNKAGIQLEDFGGDIPTIEISGLTGKGVDKLQELIATQAGLMDLRADRKGAGEAAVIESRKDSKLGVIVKTLVQIGTLKRNDVFVCGETWGKVRWMFDADGKRVEEAVPGYPYDIHGFETVPEPGDTLIVVEDESTAQSIAEFRKAERADKINQQAYLEQQKRRHAELLREEEDRKRAIELGEDEDAFLRKQQRIRDEKSIRDIPVMVKGDVGGSLEAIRDAINQIPQTEFRIRIVNAGVGAITERDIDDATLAEPRCIILGFNVSLPQKVRDLAAKAGVEVQSFRVIFGLVDWLKGALEKQLKPREEVSVNGRAKILQVFEFKGAKKTQITYVAGCSVILGTIRRGDEVQIWRDGKMIHEADIHNLKHFKDNVKTVKFGQECGISLGGQFYDMKEGDEIVSVNKKQVKRTLDEQYEEEEEGEEEEN